MEHLDSFSAFAVCFCFLRGKVPRTGGFSATGRGKLLPRASIPVGRALYRMEEEGFYHVTDATPVHVWNENQNYRFEFSNYEGFRTTDDGFPRVYHLIFIVFDKQGQPLQWFDTVTQWRTEHEQWKAECEA